MKLKVCEIFVSIQGEGEVVGMLSNFIRLFGCNLHCNWCNSKYALEEGTEMEIDEVIAKLDKSVPLVTITGGEPLLQQTAIADLLWKTKARFNYIIETNGTILPNYILQNHPIIWAVSPKLSNSGCVSELNFPPKLASYFKFVISDYKDLFEMIEYCAWRRIPLEKVIVQPSSMEFAQPLADWIVDNRFPVRFIPQIHKWLWCGRRGK